MYKMSIVCRLYSSVKKYNKKVPKFIVINARYQLNPEWKGYDIEKTK